jgi:hypothetical protein
MAKLVAKIRTHTKAGNGHFDSSSSSLPNYWVSLIAFT